MRKWMPTESINNKRGRDRASLLAHLSPAAASPLTLHPTLLSLLPRPAMQGWGRLLLPRPAMQGWVRQLGSRPAMQGRRTSKVSTKPLAHVVGVQVVPVLL